VRSVRGSVRPSQPATALGSGVTAELNVIPADAAERPIIVALRFEGAEITIVVGDPTGTTLVYFPPDYAQTALGSLLSVGDREAADADRGRPPLVADYFGHWSAHSATRASLRRALR
jgi:hypothetical protein